MFHFQNRRMAELLNVARLEFVAFLYIKYNRMFRFQNREMIEMQNVARLGFVSFSYIKHNRMFPVSWLVKPKKVS